MWFKISHPLKMKERDGTKRVKFAQFYKKLNQNHIQDNGTLDEKNLKDLKDVLSLLFTTYSGSKRSHLIVFNNTCICPSADGLRDGKGGSALLTELEHCLGQYVRHQREKFKILLAKSITILKWPLYKFPSGAIAVGLKPSPSVFSYNAIIMRTISLLPVDRFLRITKLEMFLGDAWWGCRSCVEKCRINQQDSLNSYMICLQRRKATYWKNIVPFKFTHMFFSSGLDHSLHLEWVTPTVLSIKTHNIWTFIQLLRILRCRLKRATSILHITGFGDIMI